MNNRILLILLTILTCNLGYSQYKTVLYNLDKNFFNEGQALPFESYFIVSGKLPANVNMVEVAIFKNGKLDETPLYKSDWKKTQVDQTTFNLPVNYKLRQNSEYGFKIRYYTKLVSAEKSSLYQTLANSVVTYIEQSVKINGNDIVLQENHSKVHDSLNEIVTNGLRFYKNDLNYTFPGFSEIIELKLKELSKVNLNENKFYQFASKKDSTFNKREENFKYYHTQVDELKNLVNAELVGYVNTISHVVAEIKEIDDYQTEKGQFVLPVNVGYGVIYNSGEFSNISYGSSPYVGLSFPLANSALKSNILSKTSISFGAYLQNFNDENGDEVTGPFIDRPVFLGVGTKAFKFLRFNAGVTALQKSSVSDNFDVNKIYVRPSININFELGLWIGQLK